MKWLALAIILFLSWWAWDSYQYDKDLERDFKREFPMSAYRQVMVSEGLRPSEMGDEAQWYETHHAYWKLILDQHKKRGEKLTAHDINALKILGFTDLLEDFNRDRGER